MILIKDFEVDHRTNFRAWVQDPKTMQVYEAWGEFYIASGSDHDHIDLNFEIQGYEVAQDEEATGTAVPESKVPAELRSELEQLANEAADWSIYRYSDYWSERLSEQTQERIDRAREDY